MPDPAPPTERGGLAVALEPDTVDALYDFALTVTWDPDSAFEAVVAAVGRHGTRARESSLVEVLARTRDHAVRLSAPPGGEVVDLAAPLPPADHPAGGSLEALALGVAGGLDPADRAVLDLGARQELSDDELATALGVSEAEALGKVEDVRQRVERLLGHYVLARVATEACPRLAEALEDPPGRLEPLADVVDTHLGECSMCTDRRHGIHSTSTLLVDLPFRPAPEELHELLSEPPEEQSLVARLTSRRTLLVLGLVGALAAAAVASGLALFAEDEDAPGRPRGRLLVDADVVELGGERSTSEIAVRGGSGVAFSVEVDVPFVSVEPSEGTLAGREPVLLAVRFDRGKAPEGANSTAVRVVAGGRTAEVLVTADVNRGPAVSKLTADPAGVDAAPCEDGTTTTRLSAEVVDDAGVRAVTARWSGVEHEGGATSGRVEMTGTRTYEAELGPFAETGEVTWSVVATDRTGARTTSPEATFEVGECG